MSDHLTDIQRDLDLAVLRRRLVDHLGRECKYPKEVYSPDGTYGVTFSPEEHAALRMEGWADQKTAGKEYRVWTAMPNGQKTTPVAVDSTFWRMLREEFEGLEPGEFSLIWSSRPPVSLTGTVLPSQWSWWRYPGENQRARFSAIALKGAKALGHSSEDGWLDELRTADFVHFKLTGSSRQKLPDGTMVESEFGAIEDARNFSITLCHVLEAAAVSIFSVSVPPPKAEAGEASPENNGPPPGGEDETKWQASNDVFHELRRQMEEANRAASSPGLTAAIESFLQQNNQALASSEAIRNIDFEQLIQSHLESAVAPTLRDATAGLPHRDLSSSGAKARSAQTAEIDTLPKRGDGSDSPCFTSETERNSAVSAYSQHWTCSEAALARTARVHPADLSKWKKSRLPARSEKRARIETALNENQPPKPPAGQRPDD